MPIEIFERTQMPPRSQLQEGDSLAVIVTVRYVEVESEIWHFIFEAESLDVLKKPIFWELVWWKKLSDTLFAKYLMERWNKRCGSELAE